jgi:hypothetical protein
MTFFHTGYRPYFDAGAIAATHNRDIDISHWGPYRYHGHTRHNVSHWGDADFEIRISQPSPTRFQYYLTGDLRTKDVIEGVVDQLYTNYRIRQSADLGAVLYGFLVRWEMTGDPAWRDKALAVAHTYGSYITPDGALPSRGFDIDSRSGRRLSEFEAGSTGAAMFLHGFGAVHALIELAELTSDKPLSDLLFKHAVWCSHAPPDTAPYWLLLSYELARTGEKEFARRLLASLSRWKYDRGIYPRDRVKWTGNWSTGVPESPGSWRIRGTVEGVHEIYTPLTGFAWNPVPSLIRALGITGLKESEIESSSVDRYPGEEK